MENVHSIDKGRKELEQRALVASEWIAKIDKGLSDADEEAVASWMRADPKTRQNCLSWRVFGTGWIH